MNSSVLRQIRDIQVQAEKLGNRSDVDSIKQFERYNLELKSYYYERLKMIFCSTKFGQFRKWKPKLRKMQ